MAPPRRSKTIGKFVQVPLPAGLAYADGSKGTKPIHLPPWLAKKTNESKSRPRGLRRT